MLRLKRILAPVDFSSRSKPAIEHAVIVAKHCNAEVVFLHVVPTLPYDAALASGFPGAVWLPSPGLEKDLRDRLHQLLEEVVPGHGGKRIVVSGDPAQTICRKVEELGIDMVVIPTTGYGAFRRLLLGSVVTKVLAGVTCPVFTGAHVEEIDTFSLRPYKNVGCAIDMDEQAEKILRFASDIAAAYRATLSVVHAIPAIPDAGERGPDSKLVGEVQENSRRKLEALLESAGVDAPLTVESGQPDEIVPAFAKNQNSDLLVVGRHGDGGKPSGLKTNAYGIIRSAPCPVVSV